MVRSLLRSLKGIQLVKKRNLLVDIVALVDGTHIEEEHSNADDARVIQDADSEPLQEAQALEDDSERKRSYLDDVPIQMKRIRKGSLPQRKDVASGYPPPCEDVWYMETRPFDTNSLLPSHVVDWP